MHVFRPFLLAVAILAAVPLPARAQAAITGTVKDASGAVLPGVTVEATSPALIEKVRAAVTDGTGQYRIVDLRPGAYSLTFALPGFNTVKRDGIELTGTFTASINAELRVGGVAETITVSGETPVVDVASTKRQTTLSSELLTTAPTATILGRLDRADPHDDDVRREQSGHSGHAADDRVWRRRRPRRRGAPDGRRHFDRFDDRRRRLDGLHFRHLQRRGGGHDQLRRARRERSQRAILERRSANRWQQLPGIGVSVWRSAADGSAAITPRAQSRRAADAGSADQAMGFRYRIRGTDQARMPSGTSSRPATRDNTGRFPASSRI